MSRKGLLLGIVSSMSLVETGTGVIVIDTLMSDDPMRAS
jgi:hypothetical protein